MAHPLDVAARCSRNCSICALSASALTFWIVRKTTLPSGSMTHVSGTLLTWNNNDQEGLSNPYTHHEGTAVEAGVKYILTKWFRERPWRIIPDPDPGEPL